MMKNSIWRKSWIAILALTMALSLALGFVSFKSAHAAEAPAPTVLADFETGTVEDWFKETVNQKVNGTTATAFPTDYLMIVPEDYDAVGKGSTPAMSDNHVALVYMHSWSTFTTTIRFPEPYTVTEETVLSFRIKVHTSAKPAPGSTEWSLVLTAADSTNESGEGYKVSNAIKQDEWLTLELFGKDLNGLVDGDGKLSGITVGFHARSSEDEYQGGPGPMHIMLDDFAAGRRMMMPPQEETVLSDAVYTDLTVDAPVLTTVNGAEDWDNPPLYDWYNDKNYYGYEKSVDGATDGNVLRMNICHWRTGALKLDFEKTIDVSEISSLKLRMFFHMSQVSPYRGYLILFSSDSDGAAGKGVALSQDVVQDEWIEVEITGDDLLKLADAEGKISGLQFGYDIHTDQNYLNWAGFVYLDRVSFEYAPWEVSFDTNGGSEAPVTQSVRRGEKATEPENPTRAGYTFLGWFLSGATEAYNFETAVTGDLNLIAKWERITYQVTFDTDGGSEAPAAQTVGEGDKAEKPADPTKAGYIFEGWFLSGATEAYNFDTPVTGALALKAKWKITYQVTFDTDGGSEAPAAQTVGEGDKAEKPADPTKTGYVFEGWFLSGATEAYNFETPVTGDLNLIAKWERITYQVTFNTDGGSEAPAAQTVGEGDKAEKPADPTKTGYVFEGWFLSGATEAYNFETPVTGNLKLTAKWSAQSTPPPVDKDDDSGCGGCNKGSASALLMLLGAAALFVTVRKF